ncbi:trypsin-3-like [Chironomus tepperi]|uniref:trypsin-3-like n=1 Tax=Chironomus tepperi TaxID=113505 RepID=UPI00391FB5A9
MKIVGIVILSCFIVYCSGRGFGRIIGGNEISIEQAPYQVAMLYFGRLRCGGSIISCKFILSAAHCMFQWGGAKIPVEYISFRAGSPNYSTGGSEHLACRYDIHPLYDDFLLDYDAVIFTLINYIKFDSLRKPIKLPYLNEPFLTGNPVTTSGWGTTENQTSSNVLLMIELKIADEVKCFNAHEADGGITTKMICAEAISKDSCNGDSGGPLVDVNTQKLAGIVSFGDASGECAIDGVPGVYTRVSSIRQWIKQIIKF